MRSIVATFALAAMAICCSQKNQSDRNNTRDSRPSIVFENKGFEGDSNTLTISKTKYILSLKGIKHVVQHQIELSNVLEKQYDVRDTLYIILNDNSSDRVPDAMRAVRGSKIDKYKIVVTNDFFKLPYPK